MAVRGAAAGGGAGKWYEGQAQQPSDGGLRCDSATVHIDSLAPTIAHHICQYFEGHVTNAKGD